MTDIRVDGGTLRSGAGDTDAVAAGVAQARDASGAALGDNAFGLMLLAVVPAGLHAGEDRGRRNDGLG